MKHKSKKQDDELDSVKKLIDEQGKDEMNDLDDSDDIDELVKSPSNIKPMSDSEVVAFCREEISRGIGGTSYGDDASEDIALSYDYFYGRKPGISKALARDQRASRYVSLDVQDAVESTVAEIMPTFDTEEIAFYTPEEGRDEEAAKLESDIVNYVFFHECNGYTLLQTCLRDALLNRNSTAKAWWDKSAKVSYETYENVNPMAMNMLLTPQSENETIEVVEQEQETTTVQVDDGQGNMVAMDSEIFTIKIKRVTVVEKPVVEAVAPEQVIVSGDHDTPELYDVRFVAHENIVTQSYLIERGVDPDIAQQLEDYNTNTEEQSRSRTAAEFDYFSSDRSVRHIRVFECYAALDVDGDGIAERRKILISGSNLLANDPIDSVALVGGVTTAIAHKYKGLSLFDKLKDIQDAKTPVMRSIIDGTQLASNPRTLVLSDGSVNMDDLLTSRTGGNVRTTNINSVAPFPTPEIPQSSYSFLDLMDKNRRERGGAAVDTASTAQSMDQSSERTVGRVMGAMELLNAQLARTFGETLIKGIFVQLHQVIRENYKGEISAKLQGQWITSTPSEWMERTGVTVSIGASSSERARQKAGMDEVRQTQLMLKEMGSVMFDEQKAYQAIVKSVSLSGVKNPEAYFVDPQSQEGQQASEQQGQQAQQAQQQQQQLEQAMAKAQQDIAKAEQDKGQAALISQQVKLQNEALKNQITQMQTIIDAKQKTNDQSIDIMKIESNERIKLEEIKVKEALALTTLEVENNKEVSAEHEANK